MDSFDRIGRVSAISDTYRGAFRLFAEGAGPRSRNLLPKAPVSGMIASSTADAPKVAMPQEIELKLELSAKVADALEASGILPGEPKIVPQHSIYFDTPKRRLQKAGVGLRIRRSGRKRIQTVKAGGARAGLQARQEWERPVSSDRPVIDEASPVAEVLGGDGADLEPLFEIRSVRRLWMIAEGDSLIELALDRGEAVCGKRTAPICEIELELKRGDPAALFAVARRIDAISPVKLCVQTKAERGYRLIEPDIAVARTEPIALAGTLTVEAAFLAIADDCLRQFRLNEALILVHRNPDALHRARVALRRLRSALSLFRPALGTSSRVFPGAGLRGLAGKLGRARDLDVLLEKSASEPIRPQIAIAREAAYDRLGPALSASEVRIFMLDLVQWLHLGAWRQDRRTQELRRQPLREYAATALDRFRRKVRKAGRHLVEADDATRHELRKDAKKLRYGVEFFAGAFDGKRERQRKKTFLGYLKHLQEELGLLNDLASIPSLLGEIGLTDDPDASLLLAHESKSDILDAAEASYESLVDAKRFWKERAKKHEKAP